LLALQVPTPPGRSPNWTILLQSLAKFSRLSESNLKL
jgi:hypothetical protein